MTIKIVLVDDQEMYRAGFRMVLGTRPELEIVGEADDGAAALELLRTVEADIVLMDVRMPGMDGIEATRRIRDADGPRVIVMTTFDLDEYAYDAIQAGASGFLLKDTSLEEFTAAIAHVHHGDAVIAPSTTRRLLDHFSVLRGAAADTGAAWDEPTLQRLTPREREVVGLIARGLSNHEIAHLLVISDNTVRVHVTRILIKLGLRDRVQVVVMAYQTKMVPVDGR